jgi:hypothetical protein
MILLAAKFNWTPEQICDMPPDYLDELICYISAESERASQRQKETQAKARR